MNGKCVIRFQLSQESTMNELNEFQEINERAAVVQVNGKSLLCFIKFCFLLAHEVVVLI